MEEREGGGRKDGRRGSSNNCEVEDDELRDLASSSSCSRRRCELKDSFPILAELARLLADAAQLDSVRFNFYMS